MGTFYLNKAYLLNGDRLKILLSIENEDTAIAFGDCNLNKTDEYSHSRYYLGLDSYWGDCRIVGFLKLRKFFNIIFVIQAILAITYKI